MSLFLTTSKYVSNRYILLNKQILFGEILILWCTKWGFEVKSSESISGQTAGVRIGNMWKQNMHFQNEVDQMEQWSFSNAFGEPLKLLKNFGWTNDKTPSTLHFYCSCILGCGKVLTAEHTHLIWDTIYFVNFIYWSLVKLFNLELSRNP